MANEWDHHSQSIMQEKFDLDIVSPDGYNVQEFRCAERTYESL